MRLPEALAVRNFRLLFLGQAVSLLGDGMVPVALAFAVLEITDSPSALGLVLAARLIPTVLLLLAAGVIADRIPRRTVMVVSDLARMLSHGAMAALLLSGAAEVWSLALLAAANGAATAFFQPASTALVPMTVGPQLLQQANALRGLAQSGGFILGPAIAGLLVATAGAGVALAVDAATFGVSALFLLALRVPDVVPPPVRPFVAELRDGWREFRARDWVWGIVLGASVANMLAAGYQVLGPIVADRELGGAGAWAAIATCFGIGSLAGGLLVLRRPVARPLLVGTLAVMFWPVTWVLLAIPAPTAVIAGGALLGGAGLMVFNALWEATLQAQIPAESLSRVSAYDWLGSLALNPIGAALVGSIAAGLGVAETLLLCAALATAVNLFVLTLPGVRQTAILPPAAPQPASSM
jgi:MFS family permease